MKEFARSVSGYLSVADKWKLRKLLKNDARIKLALPDAYLEIYSDGWLPARSTLRVRSQRHRWRRVELRGRHVSKADGPLHLKVFSPEGKVCVHKIEKKGPFSLQIDLPIPAERPAFWTFAVEADGGFVPSEHEPGSGDVRERACLIDEIRLQ